MSQRRRVLVPDCLPSMLPQLATRAGLYCDLIRRSVDADEIGAVPPSAPVIWAALSLKRLAKQVRKGGDDVLFADYASAARGLDGNREWRLALTTPAVVELTERAVQKITSAQVPD